MKNLNNVEEVKSKELKIEELEAIKKSLLIEETTNTTIENPLKYDFQCLTLVNNFNDVIKYNKDYNNLFKRVIDNVVKISNDNKVKYNFTSETLKAIKILIDNLTIFKYDEIAEDISNSQLKKDCQTIFEGMFNNKFKQIKKEVNGVEVAKFTRNLTASLKTFINLLIKTILSNTKQVIINYKIDNKNYCKLINEDLFNKLSIENLQEAQKTFINTLNEIKED